MVEKTDTFQRSNDIEFIDDGLRCPNCGGENLHHGIPFVFDRSEDDEEVTVHHGSNTAKMPSRGSGNPSLRRDGIVIPFSCEHCDAQLFLDIAQHKGSTLVSWRYHVVPAGLNPDSYHWQMAKLKSEGDDEDDADEDSI